MQQLPLAVTSLSDRLARLGWVTDLFVAGSLATGDYVPGVSDLDLVAVVGRALNDLDVDLLISTHQDLDRGLAAGADLGCIYVTETTLADMSAQHPTWTHGGLVRRPLSGIARAELVRDGFAVFGRPPTALLPPMTDDQVRDAARAELCGYWAFASRHPWWWVNPVIADLGLTSMARGRFAMQNGHLLTKREAIEQAHAPHWLIDQLRARRAGDHVVSPPLRTGWIAWRDARTTVRKARRNQRTLTEHPK